MADETTDTWWRTWLEAEIARSERALFAAQPHEKIEIWQRLDVLHALRGKPPLPAPDRVLPIASAPRHSQHHPLGRAIAAAAFASLVIAALALAD